MASAPVTVPMGYDDPGRDAKCWPTQPIANIRFDGSKIKCYYMCMGFCFNLDTLIARTYADIYPNGMLINVPQACCCCCVKDSARFIFFDAKMFGKDPYQGGCCKPYPYWCPHCCGFCGETLVFQRASCIGCPDGGLHAGGALGIFCPYDILFALAPGEPARVTSIIAQAKQKFEQAGCVAPKPTVQGAFPGGQMNNHHHGGAGGLGENML